MSKKTYSEKLKSPKWQKKRLEILQRDNFKCVLCGDTETELHVNHKKYTGEPHEAPNEDLETLCKYCHFLHHWIVEGELESVIKQIDDNCYAFAFKLKSHEDTHLVTFCERQVQNYIMFRYKSDFLKKIIEMNNNFDKLSNLF